MKKIIAGLLALVLVFSLLGCMNTQPDPGTQTTAPAAPAAVDTYTQAATPLREAQNVKTVLTTKKTVTSLGGSVSSSSKQVLTLAGIGTDTFTASLQEDIEVGVYDDQFTEYFADGVLYVNNSDIGYFQGYMTAEDFMARFAPAVLLDEALYASITAQESDTGVTLTFSNPTAAESWALPAGAKLLSASGTATITENTLKSTAYTINYALRNVTVSLEITAQSAIYSDAAPEVPQDSDRYLKIDSIEVPRLYHMAIMNIYESKTASSTVNETIICQAASYVQTTNTNLHYIFSGNGHHSSVEQSITAVDGAGQTQTYTLHERFQDGQYTYVENGGAVESNPNVTAADMVEYVQNYYTKYFSGAKYILSAKMEDVNDLLYIEIGFNSKWGTLTAEALSYELFDSKFYLGNHSTAYNTTVSTHYMFLDPVTGFPVSIGVNFAGVHTIEGQDYVLAQEVSQSFRLADSSTYTELTGEIPAETAPEEQATPLLYRVTGSDGQEMYLMGTIHIGDEKTAFLPEEVYTAFNASDALAVEADIMAFDEQLENDPQLADKIAELFMNPGYAATKDQLDPRLYAVAVKLLKASGNYSSNAEYVKPYMWSSSIENFFLTFSRLRSEKGMDMRLLRLAKEQNKKILEVESGLFQMEMFANFSDELQEILLGTTVAGTVTEYCDESQELYDLWCAGDESALREVLKEDTSGMPAEELALYQEYTDAMIIERNDNMLDVAVSYLEGGDTVFFAVGLAHLLRENGLVDTLREAGYTVEQVIYS